MPGPLRTVLAFALLLAPGGFAQDLYGILGVGPVETRRAPATVSASLPSAPVPATRGEYDGTLRTDDAALRALLSGPRAWRFMAAGEASYYWGDAKTANLERYRPDEVSAAVLGWFDTRGDFVYLPKGFPVGQGFPLLVVHEHEGVRRWMFVRKNDRGPYTGPRITPVNTTHLAAMGEPRVRPKPDPDRPIDLSRGAMRKFMDDLGWNMKETGLLRGVRVYLPPSDLLPEVDPKTSRAGAGASGYTVRSMIDEALATWPPVGATPAD